MEKWLKKVGMRNIMSFIRAVNLPDKSEFERMFLYENS